jgi:hypothetical protein
MKSLPGMEQRRLTHHAVPFDGRDLAILRARPISAPDHLTSESL